MIMKAYVFTGQGSQYVGMGRDLFDKYSSLTTEADDILGYSIKQLCLQDPDTRLDMTLYTQPALYVVNSMNYLEKIEGGALPDYLAGYSSGEHGALFAAGVYDFATGLKIVKKRASLMSKATGGRMATVSGFHEVKVNHIIEQYGVDDLYIAGINNPVQIVIAGAAESVIKAEPIFMAEGARSFTMHPVEGAYHTPLMEEARKEFLDFLNDFSFQSPRIPIMSNILGAPYEHYRIKERMASQLTDTYRWPHVISYLLQNGVDEIQQIGSSHILNEWTNQIKLFIHR